MAQNEEKTPKSQKIQDRIIMAMIWGRSPCDCAGCRNCIELYKYLQIKKELCRRHKLLFYYLFSKRLVE